MATRVTITVFYRLSQSNQHRFRLILRFLAAARLEAAAYSTTDAQRGKRLFDKILVGKSERCVALGEVREVDNRDDRKIPQPAKNFDLLTQPLYTVIL